MKLTLAAVLLAACADSATPEKIVPPDHQALMDLYPTVQRVTETGPFALDLGTCETANHAVSLGDAGNQFVLAHVNDAGACEVWIGFASTETGLHADYYCAFEPYGTASVTTDTSGSSGCGGPPGTQPLAIQSPRCVALY